MGSARYRTSGRTADRESGRPARRGSCTPWRGWWRRPACRRRAAPARCARKELALVYLNALRVWLADDTEDMAKTMAALDRGLRQAEMLIRLCGFGALPGAGGDTPAGG